MLLGPHRFVEREQSQTGLFENFANPVRFEPMRVWDDMTEFLRDNFVVMGCIALSSKIMGVTFAWVLDVNDKECCPWLEKENENLGYILDRLEVVIGCGTLSEQVVNFSIAPVIYKLTTMTSNLRPSSSPSLPLSSVQTARISSGVIP